MDKITDFFAFRIYGIGILQIQSGLTSPQLNKIHEVKKLISKELGRAIFVGFEADSLLRFEQAYLFVHRLSC